MDQTALFGFLGVLFGSATTGGLTVYRERLVAKKEREARALQQAREREVQHQVFQRDSLIELQTVLSDMVRAVNSELDRMLDEFQRTQSWPVRQWETPTAVGWQDTYGRVEALRARVFDDELRGVAGEMALEARKTIWSTSLDDSKRAHQRLEENLFPRFNGRVAAVLPTLF